MMLIHELLKNDPDIFPEEAPLIVLDWKSAMCMYNNGKDTKHTRHIARRMHFVRNGEKCKMQKIDWCEGGLQLADIVQYTMYPSTARGSSLAVNDCTMDVRVTSDRPSTP